MYRKHAQKPRSGWKLGIAKRVIRCEASNTHNKPNITRVQKNAVMHELDQGGPFRLQASGFRLQASGFRLQAPGFRLQAS